MTDEIEHLSLAQILALEAGTLAPPARAQAHDHLGQCARCAASQQWLRRTIEAARADQLEAPPPAAALRVRERFRQRPRTPQIPRRSAALRYDSASARPAYGLRGAPAQERQLLFDVDQFTIDLRLTPSDAQWIVSGQLLGPEISGLAELEGPDTHVRAPLSDLCEFTLAPVPAGEYTLALRLETFEVVITDLRLDR